MTDTSNIEFREVTLGAGESFRMGAGNYLSVLSASAPLTIELLASNNVFTSCDFAEQGYSFDLPPRKRNNLPAPAFDQAVITSATAQTVKVVTANAKVSFNQISGSVSLSAAPPACQNFGLITATTTGAGSTYWLVDTNSRKKVLVQANPTNTGTIRLTDGASNYHTLYAGDSLELEAAGTIKWRFSAAATDSVHFMEMW